MRHSKTGFTLVELIVVLIIIAILAVALLSMFNNMTVNAICTEAITTMGVIRNAVRMYCMADNNFISYSGYLCYDNTGLMSKLGLTNDDISGTYFGNDCYSIVFSGMHVGSEVYCHVYGAYGNNAPKATQAQAIADDPNNAGTALRMDISSGQITQHGISKSGYQAY